MGTMPDLQEQPPSRSIQRSLTIQRIAAGAVLGALLALLLATLLDGGAGGPGTGLLAEDRGDDSDARTPAAAPFEAPAGSCLTWTLSLIHI